MPTHRPRLALSPSQLVVFSLLILLTAPAHAAETQIQYLSGKGKDDPVKWDFTCSAGQNANTPSTIGVPSNWELQGFGTYTYGTERLNPWPKVTGHYKRTFTVPADWADKRISIVFEGVMTDTQVTVNGQSAGPLHAGGYYRFKYDISKLLKPAGQQNDLEVTVDDESATPSVNNAERRGDYWNYAGIYRPVYLEAVPTLHINQVAIDAKADGTLNADVTLFSQMADGALGLSLQIRDAAGNPVGDPIHQPLNPRDTLNHFTMKFVSPKLWTAETPNLYTLEVTLGRGEAGPYSSLGTPIHTLHQKFGFRTLEARGGEGLFLNGKHIMFKGVDRHSFWPDSGRCLSEKISRDDIQLMKDMNMNAVRMSHYPPDQHFLDACDEMGLYVLDELAGWHQAYDTPTGQKLVREMVTRDVNHPSILFWDNGNEGGWNNALDSEFAKYDPQNRAVLHPQQTRNGIDNSHYPQFGQVITKSAANNVFFPTEMLHGLYDGGHGAGLEDYWNAMLNAKASAGGFLWVLADETLKRTDQGGKLDSHGNQAPDGIVGPYREKEGSYYTIKQLWSPIVQSGIVTASNGQLSTTFMAIENRYDFIDARNCSFAWELRKLPRPNDNGAGSQGLAAGKGIVSASIPPHAKGNVELQNLLLKDAPPDSTLFVRAAGPDGREIMTWSIPISANTDLTLASAPATAKISATETPETLTATVADLSLRFNKKTGQLAAASRAGKTFSLINGPRLLAANPTPAAPARGATAPTPLPPLPDSTLTSFKQSTDKNDLLLTAAFDGPMNSLTYRLHPNGWLTIDYAYTLNGPHEYFGVGFDYPEPNVQSMRYLGEGPSTIYQNRLAGGTLNVWDKKYNNTIVGDPDNLKPGEHFDYPIFKGYYNGIRWLQLSTTEGPITALLTQDSTNPLYVQLLTPDVPPPSQIGQTGVPFPSTGLSFLHAIPAIGSKFNGPKSTGPQGQPAIAKGQYKGTISLYFGDIPK